MKNFRKIALGLLTIVLAISASAFTNAKSHGKATSYTFVHLAKSTSNLRTDYIFRTSPAGCASSTNNCKSIWTQDVAPNVGDNPDPSAVQGAITQGNYLGM
jgi:hypothetical protein